jgi:hypothetical protein
MGGSSPRAGLRGASGGMELQEQAEWVAGAETVDGAREHLLEASVLFARVSLPHTQMSSPQLGV